MHTVYLLLGGNMGDRLGYLTAAKKEIEKSIGNCVKQSSLYETAPWGFVHDSSFLNQLLIVETQLAPVEVMEAVIKIEQALGRTRKQTQWDERTIDIDVLFYDYVIQKDDFLEIPHPRISERKFVLIPLTEIAPTFVHPVYQKTAVELLANCQDGLTVTIYQIPTQHAI